MDNKKLRQCFGNFATGIIIATGNNNYCQNNKYLKFINNIFGKIKILNSRIDQKNNIANYQNLYGLTINSFSSLSLNPPLIQFSIDNKSSNLKFFKKNNYFLLNILSKSQLKLSNAFATKNNSNKFQIEDFKISKFGNPIFKNSLAYFECQKYKIIKAGDHHIIIGKIIDFNQLSNQDPLLYYKGQYICAGDKIS